MSSIFKCSIHSINSTLYFYYIRLSCMAIEQNREKTPLEPVFVNLLRSSGIDSQPGGPVQQPFLSYRPARVRRLAKSIPRNRFLGFITVYKYGLRANKGKMFGLESRRQMENLHVHRSTGYFFYTILYNIHRTLLPSVTKLSPSWCEGKFRLLDH